MVTIDQLEVLLRSVPQYFLFGGLALYLYAWIEKKPKRGIFAEILLLIIGTMSLVVMVSGMIPSPQLEGINTDHIEKVIKMLSLLVVVGALSLVSIVIRALKKKAWNPLVIITFTLSLWLFFSTTKVAKIEFKLTPSSTEVNE